LVIMAMRNALVLGAMTALAATLVALGCSKSTPNPDPTPPGTTPVTTTPYPECAPLDPGTFTANAGSYATPSTNACTKAGGPTAGAADAHCVGVTPQATLGSSCDATDAGSTGAGGSAPAGDAGPGPTPGPCDENGTDGAYGGTMFGTEGDDDDCKYHVSYTATPICENNGTYFVVKATHLAGSGGPLTGASTAAEICLSDTHPAPAVDGRPPGGSQQVVEGPPGTYTIGPVVFDAPGDWTVRFHFNEFCCDTLPTSPHGHAAFHVTVP
jgi:hypothetical protein